jgi:transcriptional regulator with XRE-family HTH domain
MTTLERYLEKRRKQIGLRLKTVLAERGFTQTQFAKLAGTKVSFISEVVNGHINLTLQTIAKLELALGSLNPTQKVLAMKTKMPAPQGQPPIAQGTFSHSQTKS